MASNTRTIQNSIDWATFYIGRRPAAVLNSEPALTSANLVQQTILAPPFKWPWNRAVASFAQPSTDTPQSLATFGWIEKASVTDGSGNVYEIPTIKMELTQDAGTGRANSIGVFLDDNNGNITFRFLPGTPDQAYTVKVIYQQRAPLMTTLSTVWTIPDMYGHIYNWGFLALMQLFADDTRFQVANSKFIASLLAVSEGLTEQDKAIFMNQWENVTLAAVRGANKTQQGYAGRQI